MLASAALALASLLPAQPAAAPKFEIKDGDRIVWIGNTLVEREQRYGYWETALHAAFPDKQFTLRNLGWSGDTVHAEARGRFDFDKPDACLKQLVSLTLELKPTVIFVSYGTNESFEGEEGLPKFEKGLEKLLDALKPANARVVLFTPLPVEKSASLPDPTVRNKQLAAYQKATQIVADNRGLMVADVFREFSNIRHPGPLTENGVHLAPEGYRLYAASFVRLLNRSPALHWDRLEALRVAIIAKNELFFHRWRPQNETYLFGFRKHEQGKNGKEIAEFDPLVAKAEEEIEKIRKTLTK